MAALVTPWTEALLVLFLLAAGMALGAMVALALGHLLGEVWRAPLQPSLSAMARAAPLLVPLALPLLLTLTPSHGRYDPVLYVSRGLALLVLWAWLGRVVSRPHLRGRTAGAALLVLVLTGAFAMQEWTISRDPGWTGNLQGLTLLVGQVAAALALATLLALRHAMPDEEARTGLERALLSLCMAVLWLSFVQYIVVYAANLPDEAAWYLRRSVGGWGWVKVGIALPALLLAIGLALVPEWRPWRLVSVSLLILAHYVAQLLWVLRPDGAMPIAVAVLAPALLMIGVVLARRRVARPA